VDLSISLGKRKRLHHERSDLSATFLVEIETPEHAVDSETVAGCATESHRVDSGTGSKEASHNSGERLHN
jgi:hypothetical protein